MNKRRAEASLLPHVGPAAAIWSFSKEVLDLCALADALAADCNAIQEGDLSRLETMLYSQAQVLGAMFSSYATKMANADHINKLQVYGLLALKAQNQCRATLATLSEIKNPRAATFIRNTATNQQVNVGELKNSANSANEVLESKPYERLDSGTPSSAVAANPKLETVGTSHRPKNARRQGALPRERI
jgi:hypothetical protein